MTVLPACFVSAKELADFGILNYLIARNWNENKKVVSYGPMMMIGHVFQRQFGGPEL